MNRQQRALSPLVIARRLAWRAGRGLYCWARREPRTDDINSDGETYVQRQVIAAAKSDEVLTVLDIGANLGDWTIPFATALDGPRRTPQRTQLHLFEPVHTTRKALKTNLAASPAAGLASVHAFAMADTCGQSRMNIVAPTGGRNALATGAEALDGEILVDTTTLSTFFANNAIASAQLVKCDAEGHDLAIMRGARDLLSEGRIDVLQFEYNYTWVFTRSLLKDVFDLVEGLPYVIGRVCPDSVEIYEAWHPELDRFFHCNYLLIKKSALVWFSTYEGSFDTSNTYA